MEQLTWGHLDHGGKRSSWGGFGVALGKPSAAGEFVVVFEVRLFDADVHAILKLCSGEQTVVVWVFEARHVGIGWLVDVELQHHG